MQALVLNITPAAWVRARLAAIAMGRRAYWSRAGALRLREAEPPALPGEGWVRCRTILGGICGTDLAALTLRQSPDSILQAYSSMPMILGHENVAEVVEAHPSVSAEWVGKRVCVEPTLGCAARGVEPACPRCRAGQFGACENFAATAKGRYDLPPGTSIGYNSRTGGSWGELFVAHESQLVAVPAGLSDAQAVLTDPLACSLHAVLRADRSQAQRVLVYGGGVLGLGAAVALRAVGYDGQIDIRARHRFQRELADRLAGATPLEGHDVLEAAAARLGRPVVRARLANKTLAGGYDIVFDCVGSVRSFNNALKLARNRGQVVMVGTVGQGRLDATSLWFGELTVLGAYGRQMEYWQDRQVTTYALVHELMLAGKLPTHGLLTHTFPLADYRHAFVAATAKGRSACVRAAFALR